MRELFIGALIGLSTQMYGQEGVFPKWITGVVVGIQQTKFYDSDVGREFQLDHNLPVWGFDVSYLPSVQWVYDGQISWQLKRGESIYGLQYTLHYAVVEMSLNYGLFSRRLSDAIIKWIYEDLERPMRVWTYMGLGYYGGYLFAHKKGFFRKIDEPNLSRIDHGLLIRFWNTFFYNDYRRGHWTIGYVFNIYVGLHRILDFKILTITDRLFWYPPLQFKVSYVW